MWPTSALQNLHVKCSIILENSSTNATALKSVADSYQSCAEQHPSHPIEGGSVGYDFHLNVLETGDLRAFDEDIRHDATDPRHP